MSKITVEQRYQKKDLHQHILDLPDTYIGSTEKDTREVWVYDGGKSKMVKRKIEYIGGLYKIFDEILVNARDHNVRCKKCRTIKINIDQAENKIEVWNDGNGIPVELHKEYKVYVPELVSGILLTSENYNQKGKIVGGKNGYGMKLTNIYSKKFIIETTDKKKTFKLTYQDNMYKKGKPIVKESSGQPEFTKITFYPDLERFGIDNISDDMMALFEKRAFDLAANTTADTKVFLNDKEIPVSDFRGYINMFQLSDDPGEEYDVIYETVKDDSLKGAKERWKVGVVYTPNQGFSQASYVNGISTIKGGTHVNHVLDNVISQFMKYIKSKHKDVKVKPAYIKENIMLFVDCVLEDPDFASQTKEEFTTQASKFATKCEVSDKFIKALGKTDLIDDVISLSKHKESRELLKSDGKKRTNLRGIPKLEDAHDAGGRNAMSCGLILAEGDSAIQLVTAGFKVIGRQKYGAFPLRGKILNVREAAIKQIADNKEICLLKQILGLKQNIDGKKGKKVDVEEFDPKKLRYGRVIIMTDQDVDGFHIKGLLMNLFGEFWPQILKSNNFLYSYATPIVKVFKKTDTRKKDAIQVFYSLSKFKTWQKEHDPTEKKYSYKYFKGLATTDAREAPKIFHNFEENLIKYQWDDSDQKCKDALDLAFDKKKADDRKVWLGSYDEDDIIENSQKVVPYNVFVDKELKHFSNSDNIRSIPSLIDGFKPSQRKVLYGSFKEGIDKEEVKVGELAAGVSKVAAYHHGEASLQGTIVKMAHDYITSNNINLLEPHGIFGNRFGNHEGKGKNHGAPRYICTQLSPIVPKIFRKEDSLILQYRMDDGKQIEPNYYLPIIPMILVNGAQGIGTGYSTSVPCFDPRVIARNLIAKTKNGKLEKMVPYYRDYEGSMTKVNPTTYETCGKYKMVNDKTVMVTEIPLDMSGFKYKEFLETLLVDDKKPKKGQILNNYKNHGDGNKMLFELEFYGKELDRIVFEGEMLKELKLKQNIGLNNMHLYDEKNNIVKFNSPEEILDKFYDFRILKYQARKDKYCEFLDNALMILKYRVKYINDVISKKIVVIENKVKVVIARLEELKYPQLSHNVHDPPENRSYDYLTDMRFFAFTEEKIKELNDEYNRKKEELDKYKNTPVEELWRNELEEFLVAHEKWLIDTEDRFGDEEEDGGKGKKSKKKKPNDKSRHQVATA